MKLRMTDGKYWGIEFEANSEPMFMHEIKKCFAERFVELGGFIARRQANDRISEIDEWEKIKLENATNPDGIRCQAIKWRMDAERQTSIRAVIQFMDGSYGYRLTKPNYSDIRETIITPFTSEETLSQLWLDCVHTEWHYQQLMSVVEFASEGTNEI